MSEFVYYRGFSTGSGCVFDEKKGFVAQSQDKSFSLDDRGTAARYLDDHLTWKKHDIPSPLISTATREKAISVAHSSLLYWWNKGIKVDTFVATIQYPSKPPNAYHMVRTADMLGVERDGLRYDDKEWLFAGSIPLKYIVEVRRYGKLHPRHDASRTVLMTYSSVSFYDGSLISAEVTWNQELSLIHTKCTTRNRQLCNTIDDLETAAVGLLEPSGEPDLRVADEAKERIAPTEKVAVAHSTTLDLSHRAYIISVARDNQKFMSFRLQIWPNSNWM